MADHLSRPIMAALLPGIDLERIGRTQTTDPEVRAARTAITSLQLQDVVVGETKLLCDVLEAPRGPWSQVCIVRKSLMRSMDSHTLDRCQQPELCQTGLSGIT